jgi:hypothetical protein
MGWFSAVTNVVKKAALAPLTVTKLQARVAGRLLTAASKVVPSATVFGSGSRSSPASAPASSGWSTAASNFSAAAASRAAAMRGTPPSAPAPSSWLSTAAAAFNPTVPTVPAASSTVAPSYAPPPYTAAPAPYAQTYQGPRDTGGDAYSGNAYDPDAPAADGYGMSPDDDRQDDASLYDGGELGDVDPTAIDYGQHFSGAAGGLAGWTDNLVSLAKGAASGALTTGAGILSKPSAAQIAAAKAAADAKAKTSGGIDTTTIAIAGVAGVAGLYLLMRKRGAPAAAVASNPRRRRRRSR